MNCEETRALLPGYVAGDAEDDAPAIAAHLSACAACAAEEAEVRRLVDELRQAGDAFRPRLLPPELTLVRAAAQARRRRIMLLAAACVAGLAAALAVALALPATAHHLPLPVGGRLTQLDDRVAGLDVALSAAQGELTRVDRELALRRQAGRAVIVPTAGERTRREVLVLRSVAAYFTARAGATMAGPVGRQARAKLSQVTLPGSAAATSIVDLSLATPPPSPGARPSGAGTVVVLSRVKMLSPTRTLVYVTAFDYGTWTSRASSSHTTRVRTFWNESVHRLVVVRALGGRWLVAEDQSSTSPAASSSPTAPRLPYGLSPVASPSSYLGIPRPTPTAPGSPTAGPTTTPSSAPTPTPSQSSP